MPEDKITDNPTENRKCIAWAAPDYLNGFLLVMSDSIVKLMIINMSHLSIFPSSEYFCLFQKIVPLENSHVAGNGGWTFNFENAKT